MGALFEVDRVFAGLVETLARRVKLEHQEPGWAIIIDGEIYTWAVTHRRAEDIAINLIESGV
jgi:hypothetical protein